MRRALPYFVLAAACAVWAAQVPARAQQPPPQEQLPQAQQTPPDPAPQPDPAAAGQAPQPDDQQQPIFRAGINFVRVDVIVTDRDGNPITDLQAGDFQIAEDGQPQSIESFRLVKLDQVPEPGAEPARPIRTEFDEESESAREDVRLVAIFLDDYHVRVGNSLSIRDPLTRFIQTQLAPTDLVTIMYPLTPLSEVRMTRNHDAIVSAIGQFMGRKYDYTPRNEFENRYAFYPATVVERVRNEVTLSALRGLVVRLGALREGRKAVILVSEGFTNSLPPQLRDPVAAIPGYMNPDRDDPFATDSPREQTAAFFANSELNSEMRLVFDAANRSNTAIYSLDPRGLAAAEFDIEQNVAFGADANMLRQMTDTLRVLADETDGRAIVNRNDLDAGLRQIVRDSSAYYLIGYNSTQAPSDGKFHKIDVRVKRSGVQVRARKGYWALTAEETARVNTPRPEPAPAVTRALSSIAEPRQGRAIRTWVGMSRGEEGRTRVTFVWEPTPGVPGVRRDQPARVALIAASDDGRPFFRGTVPDVALASAAPAAASSPASAASSAAAGPSQATFEVEPGRLQLHMSVEGAGARVIDTDTSEVTVPDLTSPQVALSTPRVLRARNALEFRAMSSDPDAVPTASREFRRTDRLLIRFDVYGPGDTQPAATARLLNRTGDPMVDLTVTAGSGRHQIDLPLSSLAPGEYLIEIKASVDGADVSELIPVRLGS